MNPIKFNDLFDPSCENSIKELLSVVNKLIQVFNALEKAVSQSADITQQKISKIAREAKKMNSNLADMDYKNFEQAKKRINEMSAEMSGLLKNSGKINDIKKKLSKNVEQLNGAYKKLNEEHRIQKKYTDEQDKKSQSSAKANNDVSNSILNIEKRIKSLTRAYKTINLDEAESAAHKKRISQEIERLNHRREKELSQIKKGQREARKNARLIDAEKNSLASLRQELSKLTAERNNMDMNSPAFAAQQKAVFSVNERIKTLERDGGDDRRNVGNYRSALEGALPLPGIGGLSPQMMAVSAAVTGLIAGVNKLIETFSEFQQKNAVLASVLGKSRAEIGRLKESAKELGASTSFTAAEVSQLQTEFAKLGFSEQEILNASKATLNLAAATGTDLATAASVAGSTLRGFSLSAKETEKVAGVMAKSFSRSALDMEKFKESMKYVAPIAKEAGVSIEETTAMLSALADAGISGSSAGTALRRILNEIGASGKPAAEALGELAAKGMTLADAQDEVGRNAQTALLVLANNTRKVKELGEAYKNTGDSLQKMADEQLNTLDGKMKLLNSAIDGFFLSLEDGDGILAEFAMGAVESLTSLVESVTYMDTTFALFFKGLEGLSEKGREDLLKVGTTESGKKIADVIAESFGDMTNKDIFADLKKSEKIFVDAMKAQGEAAKDAAILFDTFVNSRKEAFKQEQQDDFVLKTRITAEAADLEGLKTMKKEQTTLYEGLKQALGSLNKSDKNHAAISAQVAFQKKKLSVIESVFTQKIKEQHEARQKLNGGIKGGISAQKDEIALKLKAIDAEIKLRKLKLQTNNELDDIQKEKGLLELEKLRSAEKLAFLKTSKKIGKDDVRLWQEKLKLQQSTAKIEDWQQKQKQDSLDKALTDALTAAKNDFEQKEVKLKLSVDLTDEAKNIAQNSNLSDYLDKKAAIYREHTGNSLDTMRAEVEAKNFKIEQIDAAFLKRLNDNRRNYETEKLKIQLNGLLSEEEKHKKSIALTKKSLQEKLKIQEEFKDDEFKILETRYEIAQLDIVKEDNFEHQKRLVDDFYAHLDRRMSLAHQKKTDFLNSQINTQQQMMAAEIKLAEVTGQKVDLAAREQKIADLELQKIKQQKQLIRQQEYASFLKSYQSYLGAEPKNPGVALINALKDFAQLKSFGGAFAGGVIDFRGEGSETSDSNWVRISDRESIIKAAASKKSTRLLGAINRMEVNDAHFEAMLMSRHNLPEIHRKESAIIAQYTEEKERSLQSNPHYEALLQEMKLLRQSVQNIKTSETSLDGFLNVVRAVKTEGRSEKKVYISGNTMPFL